LHTDDLDMLNNRDIVRYSADDPKAYRATAMAGNACLS